MHQIRRNATNPYDPFQLQLWLTCRQLSFLFLSFVQKQQVFNHDSFLELLLDFFSKENDASMLQALFKPYSNRNIFWSRCCLENILRTQNKPFILFTITRWRNSYMSSPCILHENRLNAYLSMDEDTFRSLLDIIKIDMKVIGYGNNCCSSSSYSSSAARHCCFANAQFKHVMEF